MGELVGRDLPGSWAVPSCQGRRCAARCARPFGPSLTAPAQLRWLAMNVAPEGDLRVKTSTSAARSTRARLAKPVPGTKILLRTTIGLSL
jgi:hypothetical protein